jgi:3-oxoacyl-[acyl-carrier-protein] synthase-3
VSLNLACNSTRAEAYLESTGAIMTQTGILGIGVFLPDDVRRNDWWPEPLVNAWRQRIAAQPYHPPPDDEGERLVWAARNEVGGDPFWGAVERRVMPPEMTALDMEIAASKRALSKADVPATEIDLVLVQSTIPDMLTTNTACTIHEALGVPRSCFTLLIEGACNAFQQQFALADALIKTGQAKRALLVQSCSLSRVLPYDQPHSTVFGDGATAVVVGPVSEGRGLLAAEHHVNGMLNKTLISTVPDADWWAEGRVVFHHVCPKNSQQMLADVPSMGRATIRGALARTPYGPLDVDFYAGHQPNTWYRSVTQSFAGLDRARYLDTFKWAGNISAANIPLILSRALDEGLLHDDDLVVTQSGGSGLSFSSLAFRWGR